MKKLGQIGKYLGGLVLVLAVGVGVLRWSMKSYQLSQKRQEVAIAEMGGGGEMVFSKAGELGFYYFSTSVRIIELSYQGQTYEFKTALNQQGQYIDTGITVEAGEEMTVEVWEGANLNLQCYGWKETDEDNVCDGWDISDYVAQAEAVGDEVIINQCWNDWENPKNPNLDFNDFVLIFVYPAEGTSSSSSSSSSSSITSDEEGKTKFIIRTFRDNNHDGIWGPSEGPLGLRWEYEYQIAGGGWQSYVTDAETGWGEPVWATDGEEAAIRTDGEPGWVSSRGLSLDEYVIGNSGEYIDFGYYPEGEIVSEDGEESFSASQPDTGAPTWLTLGSLIVAGGLLIAKAYLGI